VEKTERPVSPQAPDYGIPDDWLKHLRDSRYCLYLGGGLEPAATGLLERLVERCPCIIRLEFTWEAAVHGKKNAQPNGIHTITSGDTLPCENASFDLVVSFWSAHHSRQPALLFREIFRVLKAGGHLIIVDGWNRKGSPDQEIHRRLHNLSISIDRERGRHHLGMMSPDKVGDLLDQTGFRNIRMKKTTETTASLSPSEMKSLQRLACTLVERVYPEEIRLIRDGEKRFSRPLKELSRELTDRPLALHPFLSLIAEKPLTSNSIMKRKIPMKNPARAGDYPVRGRKLSDEEKPRQRMIQFGPEALKNHELLAVLLVTGTTKENVLEMAKRLMQEYGSRAIAQERSVRRLMDILGIGPKKACQIVAAFELGRRFFEEPRSKAPTIMGAEDAYEYLKDMAKLKREHFRGLYLNTRGRLIRDEVISIGTLNMSVVHPREVFLLAVEFSAAAVILAHNHPSGDPTPSQDDLAITRQMVEAGKVMGIEIFDHIIIGEESYISLHREGKLGRE
jgi:DNA repair protein RadC